MALLPDLFISFDNEGFNIETDGTYITMRL